MSNWGSPSPCCTWVLKGSAVGGGGYVLGIIKSEGRPGSIFPRRWAQLPNLLTDLRCGNNSSSTAYGHSSIFYFCIVSSVQEKQPLSILLLSNNSGIYIGKCTTLWKPLSCVHLCWVWEGLIVAVLLICHQHGLVRYTGGRWAELFSANIKERVVLEILKI